MPEIKLDIPRNKFSVEEIQLAHNVWDVIKEQKISLTQYLDIVLKKDPETTLDGFQRLLKKENIITQSVPGMCQADQVQAFFRTSISEMIFPEYVSRQVHEAIAEDTILPYLIGLNTVITGDSYKSFYVDDQPAAQHKVRVGEAAELPTSKIVGKEHAITIWKYGRAIDLSYEAIRRMQIDMLSLYIRRIAMQTAKDKVYDILDVIENGDGNSNAAATYDLTALDTAATAGTLTAKGFLKFLMKFNVFPCDTLIADEDTYVNLVLTNTSGLTVADLIKILAAGNSTGFNITSPQMPNRSLKLFWHEDVTANDLIGINSQNAIEQVTEAGSDVQEADRFVKRQVQTLTISENNGYQKIFNEATGILKIGA